jgi:uncharacterized OB-fold protein
MIRKIRISFVVALVGYVLVFLGITYYVNSTASVDPNSNCNVDLACLQANLVRTLQVDATLYSLIGALVLAGLAWMLVPEGKRKAVSGIKPAPSTSQPVKQNVTQAAKNVARPAVVQPGIKCTRCGADNLAASKFCVECGQSLIPPLAVKNTCVHCGAENLPANKFCVECGQSMLAPAKKTCAHCGAVNEPGYSFCTDCGTPFAAPHLEPESQTAVVSSSISDIPSAT